MTELLTFPSYLPPSLTRSLTSSHSLTLTRSLFPFTYFFFFLIVFYLFLLLLLLPATSFYPVSSSLPSFIRSLIRYSFPSFYFLFLPDLLPTDFFFSIVFFLVFFTSFCSLSQFFSYYSYYHLFLQLPSFRVIPLSLILCLTLSLLSPPTLSSSPPLILLFPLHYSHFLHFLPFSYIIIFPALSPSLPSLFPRSFFTHSFHCLSLLSTLIFSPRHSQSLPYLFPLIIVKFFLTIF